MPIPVVTSPKPGCTGPQTLQAGLGASVKTAAQQLGAQLANTAGGSEFAVQLLGEGGVLKLRKVGDFRIIPPALQHGGFLVHKTGEGKFEPYRLENTVPAEIEKILKKLNNSLFETYHLSNPIEVKPLEPNGVPLSFSYLLHVTNTDYKVLPENLRKELLLHGGKIQPMDEHFEDHCTEGLYVPTFVRTEVALLEKIILRCNPDSAIHKSMQNIKTCLEKFGARNIQFKMLEFDLDAEQVGLVTPFMYRRIQQEAHFAIPITFMPAIKEKGDGHIAALAFTKTNDGNLLIEMMNRGLGVDKFHQESPDSSPEKPKFNTVIAYNNVSMQEDGSEGTFNLATLRHLLTLASGATQEPGLETIELRMAEFYNTLGRLCQQPRNDDVQHEPVFQAPQKSGNCGYSIVRAYTRTLERNARLFDGIDYLKQAVLLHHARQFVEDAKPLAQQDAKVNANLEVIQQHVLPQLEIKVQQAKQRATSIAT